MLFFSCKERRLFSSNLSSSLVLLQKLQHNIFSAPKEYQFIIRIKNLCHESVANLLSNAKNPLKQASTSTRNPWDDYAHHLECDRAHIEDTEPLRENILKANMERYPDQPCTEVRFPRNLSWCFIYIISIVGLAAYGHRQQTVLWTSDFTKGLQLLSQISQIVYLK